MKMGIVFETPDGILDAVGRDLGTTDWVTITQDRINMFADATGDHQWIHVDTERAKNSPFGGTIAHGFLTVSLVANFFPQLLSVEKTSMGINYGCNKVRFPAPVPSGSRVRAKGEIVSAEEVKGGVQVAVKVAIEVEGNDRPACVLESIARFLR